MLRTSISHAALTFDRYLTRETSIWTLKSDNECIVATLGENKLIGQQPAC